MRPRSRLFREKFSEFSGGETRAWRESKTITVSAEHERRVKEAVWAIYLAESISKSWDLLLICLQLCLSNLSDTL